MYNINIYKSFLRYIDNLLWISQNYCNTLNDHKAKSNKQTNKQVSKQASKQSVYKFYQQI